MLAGHADVCRGLADLFHGCAERAPGARLNEIVTDGKLALVVDRDGRGTC